MRLDLLEPRRRQLGVPDDRLLPVGPLLRRGGLIGLGLVAVPLLLALGLLLRQHWLEARISEVQPLAERSTAIRAEAEGLRRRVRGLQATNRKLTTALLAVRSSSALLRTGGPHAGGGAADRHHGGPHNAGAGRGGL